MPIEISEKVNSDNSEDLNNNNEINNNFSNEK